MMITRNAGGNEQATLLSPFGDMPGLPRELEVWRHPEIGWCLVNQAKAASRGSAYDNTEYDDRDRCAISNILAWTPNEPTIVAELASDGWWWRLCQPYGYGLPE